MSYLPIFKIVNAFNYCSHRPPFVLQWPLNIKMTKVAFNFSSMHAFALFFFCQSYWASMMPLLCRGGVLDEALPA
ncbi:hypothetical protein BDV36DRAFT_190576 [Aspergillus pseudocaelatus]|uniref:Uncharacterized protein n=1 Tax=Aspergillus pseudocaelatus TaxID=1825620 RepID=A0ABQ6WIP7_9EURO|nr:hypothetical protein BDV36DRAFT_190576 [Aspergillus pseudocaelatus]